MSNFEGVFAEEEEGSSGGAWGVEEEGEEPVDGFVDGVGLEGGEGNGIICTDCCFVVGLCEDYISDADRGSTVHHGVSSSVDQVCCFWQGEVGVGGEGGVVPSGLWILETNQKIILGV